MFTHGIFIGIFLPLTAHAIVFLCREVQLLPLTVNIFSDMKAEEFSCVLNKSVPRRREMRPLEVSHLKQVFSSKLSFRKSDISIILLFNSVISGENTKKFYLHLFATKPPFRAGCMFQHVDLLLLQRLKEPLVESLTMLLWETQEERRQRAAWSRPAFLNVGGGGGGCYLARGHTGG